MAVNHLSDCNLTKIILPNSIREINQYAFSGNRLTKLVIPSSCKRVGGGMKTKDLIKLLERNGWEFKRHGANHDVYVKGS